MVSCYFDGLVIRCLSPHFSNVCILSKETVHVSWGKIFKLINSQFYFSDSSIHLRSDAPSSASSNGTTTGGGSPALSAGRGALPLGLGAPKGDPNTGVATLHRGDDVSVSGGGHTLTWPRWVAWGRGINWGGYSMITRSETFRDVAAGELVWKCGMVLWNTFEQSSFFH